MTITVILLGIVLPFSQRLTEVKLTFNSSASWTLGDPALTAEAYMLR